ncbi:hypothetical protein J6590_103335 [Homalodisca vitripennis]|nr:hypothetical protein J6590_103335 [Homalodisca vitripennis]
MKQPLLTSLAVPQLGTITRADIKNWYSPITIKKFGIGVVKRVGGSNIKNQEQQEREKKLESELENPRFECASASVCVRGKIF